MDSDKIIDKKEIREPIPAFIIKNKDVAKFLEDSKEIEVIQRRISDLELDRITKEYPNIFKLDSTKIKSSSILSISLVKRDLDQNNHIQLKKIKLYIDETNEKIIKILQN